MYTKKIQVTSGIFHVMPGDIVLDNCFILCHRKYNGQHNQTINASYAWCMMGRAVVTPSNIHQPSYFDLLHFL